MKTIITSSISGEETESKKVMLAITVGEKSLFVPEFFQKIQDLDYPQSNLFVHITVQNSTQYHYIKLLTDPWKSTYQSVKIVPSKNPAKAKQEAIHYAKNFKADYIFFISSVAHFERPDTLKALLKTNTKVVAPFLKTYEKFYYARRLCNVGLSRWLNDSHSFPTLATQKGLREENYDRILIGTNFATKEVLQYRNVSAYNDTAFWITLPQRQKETIGGFDDIDKRSSDLGLKPVDLIRYAYLVKTEVLPERDYRDYFEHENVTFANASDSNGIADSIFSQKLQELDIPIFVLNDHNYGQLVNIFDYLEDKVHPELTRLMENHDLWQRRYIIDKVIKTLTQDPDIMPEILPKDTTKPGHCPDTYQMVMFTPTFCEHMIEEAEYEDNWFLSGNAAVYDARNKRKESVPTTDINLWQYGLEEMWMAFINFYLYPRKCTFYPGHPGLDLGGHFFTVRYRWEEQPALKPHHDNSLYSINVALNQIGKDFEGGGTHFLR